MAKYNKKSLYGTTPQNRGVLGILEYRPIPRNESDTQVTLQAQYNYRPDLLASDLYGDPDLWWVFKARNPNIIDDPIFDFVAGIEIKLPPLSLLRSVIGE